MLWEIGKSSDKTNEGSSLLAAVLVDPEVKDKGENVRRSPLVIGAIILTLGILSVTGGICANEASEVDTSSKATPGTFASDSRVSPSLPLQGSEDLTYGARS